MEVQGVSGADQVARAASSARQTPAPRLRSGEAATPKAPQPKEPPAPEKEQASAAEKRVETAPRPELSRRHHRVDEATERLVVDVLDEEGEAVKQIPPEEMLKLAASARDIERRIFDENA